MSNNQIEIWSYIKYRNFEERENSPLKLQKELKMDTQHKQCSLSASNAIAWKTTKKRNLNVSATEDKFIVI